MSHHRPSLGPASVGICVVPGLVVTLLLGAAVSRVDAGVGGQSTAVWPATAVVGTTFDATVTIRNFSTPPNDTENITVTALFVTPACASSESPLCLLGNRDPGVFDILTAVGDAGSTPCPGIGFVIGIPDPSTGEVQLTPSQTVTLGPSSGPLAARTCQVNLSLFVKKLPANPDTFPGVTNVLGHVALHGVTSGVNGSASSTAQITISPEPPPPPPPPSPPRNVPTLSHLAMGVLAAFFVLGGAAVLRRRTA